MQKEHQNHTTEKKALSKHIPVIAILAALVVLIIAYRIMRPKIVNALRDNATISLEEYNQIENQMTYDDCVRIIGCEGKRAMDLGSLYGTESLGVVIYTWDGTNGANSNATIMFNGENVINKSQKNLK